VRSVQAERSGEVSRVNRFAPGKALRDVALRSTDYLSVDEVESALASLSAQYPEMIELIELPHKTWEGRTSHCVRIHAGQEANRDGVLFTGSMHAREWGGADICVNFALNAVDAYVKNIPLKFGKKAFTKQKVRNALETLDIFVFPCVNPDGRNYSQNEDLSWRKNRNPAGGVDVNRNFDFLWGSGIGTSEISAYETYRGTAPFSEPESRNVAHLLDNYSQIRYYVDIHSYGQLILYSWGDDQNQNKDPAQCFKNPEYDGKRGYLDGTAYMEYIPKADMSRSVSLANRMNRALKAANGRPYTVQQSVGLYPTSATSDDYSYCRHFTDATKNKVHGFTIEFGESFVPPYQEMLKVIAEVNAAMAELCLAAASGK
jgi:murein tripeptide amidase MpaA